MKRIAIGSENGLSSIQRQAIIETNSGLLSIEPLETHFLIKISNFSFTKMHLKISSSKWRPFCPRGDEISLIKSPGLNKPKWWLLMISYMASEIVVSIGSGNGLSREILHVDRRFDPEERTLVEFNQMR